MERPTFPPGLGPPPDEDPKPTKDEVARRVAPLLEEMLRRHAARKAALAADPRDAA